MITQSFITLIFYLSNQLVRGEPLTKEVQTGMKKVHMVNSAVKSKGAVHVASWDCMGVSKSDSISNLKPPCDTEKQHEHCLRI